LKLKGEALAVMGDGWL